MATYVYECSVHKRGVHGGVFEIEKPMAESSRVEHCPACARQNRSIAEARLRHTGVWEEPHPGTELTRIFTTQNFIMRPGGYNLRPGDQGAFDFRRELELGEVRTIGSQERYAETVASDPRPAPAPIMYSEDQRYELAQLGRVVDRQIREEMPDLVAE